MCLDLCYHERGPNCSDCNSEDMRIYGCLVGKPVWNGQEGPRSLLWVRGGVWWAISIITVTCCDQLHICVSLLPLPVSFSVRFILSSRCSFSLLVWFSICICPTLSVYPSSSISNLYPSSLLNSVSMTVFCTFTFLSHQYVSHSSPVSFILPPSLYSLSLSLSLFLCLFFHP